MLISPRGLQVSRVASDMEMASIKRAKVLAEFKSNTEDVHTTPVFTDLKKKIIMAIDDRRAKRDDIKISIVRYTDRQSTLRKRRADVVKFYKGLEKLDKTVKPRRLPASGQCHCTACDDRRKYKEPSEDMTAFCLAAWIEAWRPSPSSPSSSMRAGSPAICSNPSSTRIPACAGRYSRISGSGWKTRSRWRPRLPETTSSRAAVPPWRHGRCRAPART